MTTDFDPHNINEGKDKDLDGIIRPQDLRDFTGQDKIVSNLPAFGQLFVELPLASAFIRTVIMTVRLVPYRCFL